MPEGALPRMENGGFSEKTGQEWRGGWEGRNERGGEGGEGREGRERGGLLMQSQGSRHRQPGPTAAGMGSC